MAKKPTTLQDLSAMGLVEVSPGVFSKQVVKLGGGQEVIVNEKIIAKLPVTDTPNFTLNKPLESYLTIDGIVAGLNGNKGLMRAHWSSTKRIKDLYRQIIREHFRTNKVRKHEGPVKVTYIGYKSSLMDWDNFCASFKHLGDSLVKEKVIVEDNPKVVQVFIPKQIKCKRAEQKVIVIIEDI